MKARLLGTAAVGFLLALVFWTTVPAQEPTGSRQAAEIALDQEPPIDSRVTVGRLENGLRYFIRRNQTPEKRAELRLVVNAGSILEDEDQLGLAHFVEHMAFNGSRHFAKGELIEYMESIGMRFGPELNAYTGFDETVYMLTVPTDKPELLDKAFLMLEDWAHGLDFDAEEIDKERGVVIEEWRLGQGASTRMLDQQFPVLLKGSRYAERIPIGKKDILENFDHEALKRFYRDWYRPDLMAVVAVGDFDPARIENLIKTHFQALKKPVSPPPRTTFPVPDHDETLISIVTDHEAPSTAVSVYHKLPPRDQSTVGAYRQAIAERLYNVMLNRRLADLTQKPDPPFIYAFSRRGSLIRAKDSFTLAAEVKEDGITQGLKAVFTEAERAKRHGFTATELEREKQDLLRSVERAYLERDKQNSSTFAAEYIRAFLQGEPIPGIAYEFELHRRFIPEISREEINVLGTEWITESNRVILISAPEKEGLTIPNEEELLAALESIAQAEIEPFQDTVAEAPLLGAPPEAGSIVATSQRTDLNITEWKLSNGIRVILKPTPYKHDEILFRAISPGGTSLADDQDHVPAMTAAQVIGSSGLGDLSAIDLRKKLSGKVAEVRPFIGQLEEGIAGSASPQDLETAFQLIYLAFTAPRSDREMFTSLTSRLKAQLANRSAMPEMAFFESVQRIMTQDHPRARSLTAEAVEEMNLEKSLAFYRDRFGDAGDFTFFLVGNVDLEAAKSLVQQYLATLPSDGRKETWRDLGIRPPKGVVKETVYKGVEPKSITVLAFTGPFQYNPMQRLILRALCSIMDTRLRNAIREDRGGTYGVNVSPSYSRIPIEDYAITINFGTDPERVEELTGVVFDEVARMKADGPTEEEVLNVREKEMRSFETDSENNAWWLSQLAHRYQAGEDPAGLLKIKDSAMALTADEIQEAARFYFNVENYAQVTLRPEKK